MKIYSSLLKILVIHFFCNEIGILSVNLNNINLGNNLDEDISEIIILIKHLGWNIKFEKRKALKKKISEELMSAVWHPERWKIEPIFSK